MAKKKTNTPRKRKRLKANPKRQAHAQLRGYIYQIWHSVDAWLDLDDDDILYLEGAEDFDIISEDTATAIQVKNTQRNITLRYQEVNNAINHYWELRTTELHKNPSRSVKFCFLTRSKIGREQDNPFGKGKRGLEVWSRCSGNEAAITQISKFLQDEGKISDEVNNFLEQASPQKIYEQLIEPITWETGSKDASFVERSISDKLILYGSQRPIPIPPSDAKKVVSRLLKEAFTVATQKKDRELNKARFFEIFEEETTQRVPTPYLQHLQMLATMRDNMESAFIGGSSDTTTQFHPPIQTEIPPPFLGVVVPRTELLTSIQTKLQSDGISVIYGGTGKGKTTLAKLTANTIRGKWFWLNFTNRDPSSKDSSSQIIQQLKQLAIAISNESAQVNVVLDDLNLQPQQLRAYREDLGVVIYRVLKRGAKILITSQHKLSNNFISGLGLSSSVAIDVPNFTISEVEQFAQQLGCPEEDAKAWAELFQFPTRRHPSLVHALLTHLQEKDWKRQDVIESILQTPQKVVEEREAARQLLMDLPEDRREFLYRLSLLTEFRKDYAHNIGEIPKPIRYPGDVFSQLVGPWIDQVNETYYTISPLLANAAKEVWSDNKIKGLQANIANAILKTKNLTTTEAWAVFTHSMAGQNKKGIIAFIYSLMNAPQNDWKKICQEFSLLAHIKIDSPEELFPGDAFLNQMFRSLQYRIAVEVQPELAPKILEIWDEETKPYEPHQSYLLSRLMLATQALRYNQVPLTAKKLINYLKYIIQTTDKHKDVGEMYFNSYGQFKEYNIDNSNFFSFLFSFICTRPSIYAPFLSDLIDALDGLQPKTRKLLLADFEDGTIESRLLIDGVWWAEANREKPDWSRCLEVFDKVIEKTIEWDYPHLAAASARGKAIIHDEYLNAPDTAHEVLQDIILEVGSLPAIEEEQAFVYLHQKNYKEALNIYERILPKWNPSSEQLDLGPLEEYRRAAICAANIDDWKKAATFFQEGVGKTQKIENIERYIGFYADAGFAHFKAGNMLNCIKFLHLALKNFEMLPQDNTDVKYFTLKKRLEHTIKWIKTIWYESEDNASELFEPFVGFCSDPERKEEFLTLPDCPIGYSWLYLSQIEYRFGHETTIFQHALQTPDREEYPTLNLFLSLLEAQSDFRNQIFDNLPQRIYQLALVYSAARKHRQKSRGAGEKGSYSISDSDLSEFASVENIIAIFVAALVVEMQTNRNGQHILAKWRANSSELPTKENIYSALDLIEPILFGDHNNALAVMYTLNEKVEKQLAASIKVIHNQETGLEDLLFAHTIVSSFFINSPWEGFVVKDLGILLSVQWLQKIEFRAKLNTPILTVPQIEKACKSNEIGKKKIGQILLAAHQAVSVKVPLSSKFFHQFRSWTESESKQKQEQEIRKNPTAQRLIKVMEKPPHLTDEDIEALNQSIKEGKMPIKFDSPFESDERENNE